MSIAGRDFEGIAQFHSLKRTSPMGEAFVGTCVLCGQQGLKSGDALKPCENPNQERFGEVLLQAIAGEETTPTP